jgi:uncharacterized repeat protein (TIGR01451 family)
MSNTLATKFRSLLKARRKRHTRDFASRRTGLFAQGRMRRLQFEPLESRLLLSTTYTVLNTNDSGAGSLRQAIFDSNASVGVVDTIAFNIDVSDPGYIASRDAFAIQPLSALPIITDPVVIDGYTQPGTSQNTLADGNNAVLRIELDGSLAGPGSTATYGAMAGLRISAGSSTVRGLAVHSFAGYGLFLQHVSPSLNPLVGGNVIEGNFVGTDVTGAVSRPNGFGVALGSPNNRIGTDANGVNDPGERNLISGNQSAGIVAGRSGVAVSTNNSVIAGNFIGTDRTGTMAFGNGVFGHGIQLATGSFNTIGGTTAAARNIISGNNNQGINIQGTGNVDNSLAVGNVIQGNFIGTDVTGTMALGNDSGVGMGGSDGLLGGTVPGARNIISGNFRGGAGVSTGRNLVYGNYIGTDITGTVPLGNTHPTPNLFFAHLFNGVTVSGIGNTIGGVNPGEANIIANNSGAGVMVLSSSFANAPAFIGNTIRGNSIYNNGHLGIDLALNQTGARGVTANDLGDADVGPNDFQNYPVLSTVFSSGGSSVVSGTLNSTENTTFTVDFYSNAVADPSGRGEGQTYLGSTTVTTDGSGNAAFNAILPSAIAIGQFVSATATDPNGSTSEFSAVTTAATFVPATISGTKFNDLNANGVQDTNEPGLANWQITLDAGADGTVDGTVTTDSNGNYSITGLHAGLYRVREVQQSGWTQTTVDPVDITVTASGQTFTGIDFGNHLNACPPPGVIIGNPNPFNLSTFSVIQYEDNFQPDANWVLSNGNTVVTQVVNADPSIFISDFVLTGDLVEGSWKVNTSSDDDFMGFVFGFQDTQHFYLFDWKQGTQNHRGFSERGMTVKVVNADSPLNGFDLWPTAGNGTRVQSLYHNTIPWQDFVEYGFRLEFQPGEFTITVTQGATVLASFTIQDSTYANGRFGFYNYSQDAVIYSGFTRATITPIPTATIEGTKFHDLDGDGVRGISEPGLAGWTIQLDAGADGSVDYTTTTDGSGSYRFTDLPLGTYRVREVQQSGWNQTTEDPQDIVLSACDDVVSGVDFGNLDESRITGTKFYDIDGSGSQDAGEPGLAYWPIFVDTNGDGIHGIGEPFTYTNLFGNYTFGHLDAGAYRVREVQQPGWVQTTPNPEVITITANGQVFADINFGNDRNQQTLVTGRKFNDVNGNGTQDSGEPGLSSWPIYVDANENGQYDLGERLAFTTVAGNYSIAGLPLGRHVIREIQRPGWTQTTADPAPVVLTVLGETVEEINFGNQRDATTLISGRKFFDADSDGVADPGEPGLRYWPIYLDTNGDGVHQAGEPITHTGWNGEYSFVGVAPGTYRVREIQQPGWTQTTANPADVVVTANGQTFEDIDFGNKSSRPGPGYEPPTDLEVTKGALRAVAGEQITYTLTVKNKGPADSYGVILGDQLQPGLVFESVTPSQGTCLGGQTIICAVGPLAVGESASITIVAHVQSWVVDEIENEVCVYSTATDTEPANNCAIVRTPIDTNTDLELVKTADGLRAIAGTDLTYTMRVTNNGPSDSTNVVLEDELPPEVTFVSAVSTHGTCLLEITTVNTVVCDLGTVANGETAIVTLIVHVGPWVPEDAIITNSATVRDRIGSGGTGIIRIPCGRSTDFELTKTGPFTNVNSEVYYIIEVTNHGPSNSAGPIVGDDLPDDINFLYAIASQGFCNQQDPLLCNLGPMVVGQTETVTVFVGVPETVIIENVRNEAVVQPPEGDPNPHNNHGGTGIRPIYGLGIVKAAPPEIPAGEYLTYTLEVTNEGPDAASNVIVGDTIPAGLIFVSATPTQGTCHSIFNPIICFLGAMEMGDVAEVEIVVFVPPSIPEGTVFVNRGYGWGGIPPVFGEATTRIIRRSDISLEKLAPPDVVAGTEMTYTLRTRNRGPSDSTNITLEDVLPPEVDFISATPSQGSCTDTEDMGQTTVSCALGDIPAGGVAEVAIVVFVPSFVVPGTVIANNACVTALVLDPDLTNNCAVVHTGVGEQSDTGLIKVSTPGPVTAGENIEYTLEAFNLGPSDARRFVLGDTLPAPLVFVSATTTQGTCDFVSGAVVCDIGYLAAGQHEFITIIAFVPPTTPDGTVIENTACIIECGHDIFHDNDCSTVRNTIRAQSVLTGVKFNDANGNGVRDPGEPGIEGWQIFLDLDGDDVLDANERSTFTDANGVYTFTGLGKTTWFVREVQDPGWLQTTLNPPGVTVTGLQQNYHGGDFGNKQGSIAGRVFIDPNNDGVFDLGEIGIGGVTITLIGTDDLGPVNRTTLTGGDGSYHFGSLRPGTYRVIESQPTDYLDGKEHLGTVGGSVDNDEFFLDLGRGQDAKVYDFAELEPAKLSGYVYNDTNDNGQIDFGEAAVPGAQITLTGTNDLNEIINQIVTTDTQGYYEFNDLRPGTYAIHQLQPAGYLDGKDTVGTLGGTVANDQFSEITLASASNGMNYNFGEHADVGLHRGQTATIGYWQNNNGQALIKSVNGGENSTALGYWLATNFANMYGANAGANNLAGKTNAQIADFYVTLFKQKGQKLDAQVLATAFAVYVTDSDLAGNNAAQYGFTVSSAGTGAATFSVGNSGAAFGVANDTRLTILQILTATNAQTVGGNLYNDSTALRNLANTVYDGINQGGDI